MKVTLKDGCSVDLPDGSTAQDLARQLKLTAPHQALAASINGETRDLTHSLTDGDQVVFWHFDDPEGREVFWHTSAHLLAQAILRLWPEAQLTIGPPIAEGFYYDFANITISEDDFPKIEKEMKAIVSENFSCQREEFSSKKEALEAFKDNPYKIELIEAFDETEKLTAYRQGEFYDLCRGPHLPSLGKIKACKLMKTSGAYWRGDSKREMLTRVYAVTFPDRKMLKEHLHRLEEAKKRDHRVVGNKLDLFSFREEAPGMPFIHPAGMVIWNHLMDYCRETFRDHDYVEIMTPTMMTRELWEKSGHWENYRDNMFTAEVEDRSLAIKPMNCPGGMLFYRHHVHSYRELPYRVAEIGLVHRFEPSGALSGMFRVRSFHQDDAHIFMKPSDIQDEIVSVLGLADEIYQTFGLSYHLELSTRPEKQTIGTDEDWELATKGLQGALEATGRSYRINHGDGAFYGPKIDIHIEDAIGRRWQCGTIQLDMSLPERFDLEYTSEDGSRQRPIMIHRALLGSVERFFGILVEHYGGRFPLWISPRQVRLLTVADRHEEYAKTLQKQLRNEGFLVEVDRTSESISKKVRKAQLDQVNYILTIGDREHENKTVALRTRDNVVHGEVEVAQLIRQLKTEKSERSPQSIYSGVSK